MTQMLCAWPVAYIIDLAVTWLLRGMVNMSTDNTLKGDQEGQRRLNKFWQIYILVATGHNAVNVSITTSFNISKLRAWIKRLGYNYPHK